MPNVVAANETSRFSESRTRSFLEKLTALGPRSSGSNALEVDAVRLVTEKINNTRQRFEINGINRLELDIQRPTGCYNLKFLTPFTLCYHEITNIVVRVGPKTPSRHAILLNCHLDTLPGWYTKNSAQRRFVYRSSLDIMDLGTNRQTPSV